MTGINWAAFGTQGNGPGQFQGPACIAFDSNWKIYITDLYLHQVIPMDNLVGTNWTTFGENGSGIGQFAAPAGILVF